MPRTDSSSIRLLLGGIVASMILTLGSAVPASAADVVNGGFETGTLAGWNLFQTTKYAGWVVLDKEEAEGGTFPMKFPPLEGNYSAYTEQLAKGTSILYQDVTLEPDSTDQLKLSFGYTSEGEMKTPTDESLEIKEGVPNQQVRIDVIKPNAPLESVSPTDILATVFATHTGSPPDLAPQTLTADLSPFAGQSVRLRFAVVDEEEVNAILDGVSVTSSPIFTPPVLPPAVPALTPSPAPSNLFSEGKLTLNKKSGSAMLTVEVPDAGTLIATDARRKVAIGSRRRKGRPLPIYVRTATVTSGGAGTIKVPIRPTAAALKVLGRRGSLPVRLTMTFTPIGGGAATQPYSAKLARRLRPTPR